MSLTVEKELRKISVSNFKTKFDTKAVASWGKTKKQKQSYCWSMIDTIISNSPKWIYHNSSRNNGSSGRGLNGVGRLNSRLCGGLRGGLRGGMDNGVHRSLHDGLRCRMHGGLHGGLHSGLHMSLCQRLIG